MKKIIVPTDFSVPAESAFAYAMAVASYTKQVIKVVHVSHPGTFINTTMPEIINEIRTAKKGKLAEFVKHLKGSNEKDLSPKIEQEVLFGFPVEELVNMSKLEECAFIIMGTTGLKGTFHNLLGTISSAVSQRARCPVWLIPPRYEFEGVQNILYAGNYDSADKKALDSIIKLSNVFDSIVHLVHINEFKNRKGKWKFEELKIEQLFKKTVPDFPLELQSVQSNSFWEGINEYVEKKKINLIVMITHHRNFWERITQKSMSKEMILHTKVPILIMHLEE